MKTKTERHAWIIQHLKNDPSAKHTPLQVDVLDREFVDNYVEATEAPWKVMPFGANECRLLGRDLAEMFRNGKLKRHTVGISDGLCHQGFPKWVYCYQLAPELRA